MIKLENEHVDGRKPTWFSQVCLKGLQCCLISQPLSSFSQVSSYAHTEKTAAPFWKIYIVYTLYWVWSKTNYMKYQSYWMGLQYISKYSRSCLGHAAYNCDTKQSLMQTTHTNIYQADKIEHQLEPFYVQSTLAKANCSSYIRWWKNERVVVNVKHFQGVKSVIFYRKLCYHVTCDTEKLQLQTTQSWNQFHIRIIQSSISLHIMLHNSDQLTEYK